LHAAIIKEAARNDWEQYIQDNPDSIAWQSYQWSAVLGRHYQIDFYPLAAIDNSRLCGVLPLYHIKTARGKDMLMSVPYAVAGGIVADNDDAATLLLEKAIDLSRQFNSCNITFKQYKIKISGELRTDDNYYNRELNIARDHNEIWTEISDANKEFIEGSGKYDLVLEYPSNDVNSFYKLLLKHHHVRGVPCVSRNWIADLIAFKMYSVAVLKLNGNIVAGTMVKEFKDTVSFPFTCIPDMSEKSRMSACNLYWKLITHFASRGRRIFHSGRIPVTDDTDAYRLGWGGTKYNYYYQYYPDNSSVKSEYAKKKGRKREIFEACWKMMPLSLARRVGPVIVRQFP
jgi:hypothetical protein